MRKATAPFFTKYLGFFFILTSCWVSTAVAIEVAGGPFVATVTTETARTYVGTISQGQSVLVAYERDVGSQGLGCPISDATVTEHQAPYALSGSKAQFGQVTFAVVNNIPIDNYESVACGGSGDAVAITYTPNPSYVGPDYFSYTLASGDVITVSIDVQDNGTGSLATISPVLLQSSVKQTTSMISSRVKRVIAPHTFFKDHSAKVYPQQDMDNPDKSTALTTSGQKRSLTDILAISVDSKTIGLSAGDASMKHGIWTNIAYTSSEDDNYATESEMDINTYIMGYDYKLSDSMAIGVAVTYENVDADLTFNNGQIDGDGYTVAPYFTMLLTDYLAMDVIAGYAIIEYDQDRNAGAVTSSVDADRQFVEFSLNGFHYIDQWSFNVNLSFLYAHEGQDSYTESDGTKIKSNNIDFSQLALGTELAYSFKHAEPYITLTYERDTQYVEISGTSYDTSGGDGGLGLRVFFSDQLSGDIYGSTKFGRDDYDEYSVLGNLRYDF